MLKKWVSTASASRLAEIELEGFSEQFPDLAREATDYFDLSNGNFSKGLMQEIKNNPVSTDNERGKAA
jgi:hypothetical protein